MEDAIAGSGIGDVFEDARNSYLLKRMEATAKRTIWALMLQVRKGKFVPSGFEVSFRAPSGWMRCSFNWVKMKNASARQDRPR